MKRAAGDHSPQRLKIEDQLAALKALGRSTDAAVAAELLRKGLAANIGLAVAAAAKKSAELERRDLIPDLLAAFDRMFINPAKVDPQCWGKSAVAEALVTFDYDGSAPFLRGATYVQMEPVWGASVDTAPSLRGTCLLALVACAELPRLTLLRFYVDRLLDPDKTVRREVLRALEQMGGADCALLMRLKARLGDKEPEVTGQALESIVHLEPELGIAFVGEFLESPSPDLQDEAALALGMARSPAAVTLLIEAWRRSRSAMILRALGLSRQPDAFDFLLEVIRDGASLDSAAAQKALEPQLDFGNLRARVALALEQKRNSGE